MRKIRITESQLKAILEYEGTAYPLDTKADDGKPANFCGDEIAVNNLDPDAPNDVTTTDNVSKKRARRAQFGINTARVSGAYRLEEGKELDNKQSSGFGMKYDALINNKAENGGGKMINNVANEINSDTRGTRNNTNQVRISRMEDDKVNNPQRFQQNGGDDMLNILKAQTKKESGQHKATHIQRKTPKEPNMNSGENGIVYFK